MLNFRELRKSKDITQAELATTLGVDQTAISNWERGKNAPRFELVFELANALGCTAEEVLRAIRASALSSDTPTS